MKIKPDSYWVSKCVQRDIVQITDLGWGPPFAHVSFDRPDLRPFCSATYARETFLEHYRPLNRLEVLVILGEATSGN